MTAPAGPLSLTPWMPKYSRVKTLLPILDGVPRQHVTRMISAIWDATGTPQNPLDWTKPDDWIPERLSGTDAQLAMRIWNESAKTANPRHLQGAHLFIQRRNLLAPDAGGTYRITDDGSRFQKDDPLLIAELDKAEGIDYLLQLLAAGGTVQRKDILPDWRDFLRQNSTFQSESVAKDSLHRRLKNLIDRGIVSTSGYTYTLAGAPPVRVVAAPKLAERAEATRGVTGYNARQRDMLRERLATVQPGAFENVIAQLLEAMGYDDVEVTGRSGDMGVDVTATFEMGITTIREYVQVKRHRKTIQRKTVDQLRGALPYHKAIRGTLITLSDFTSGCAEAALFPGAAPITLIDGDKLLDLLIEHQIGMRRQQIDVFELDEAFLDSLGPPTATDERDLDSES